MNLFGGRTYRKLLNTDRFEGFEVKYLESSLWIATDPCSFDAEMKELAQNKLRNLRESLDEYIQREPFFKKSLKPFQPADFAPRQAVEMAAAATRAGVGPMATVAALFAREIGDEIRRNFPVSELLVENGGDMYLLLNNELLFSVLAGESILSERIGLLIPPQAAPFGICTSSATTGTALSYGKADAVVVLCNDVLLADAMATALGNQVKSPEHVEKVIRKAENYPEIQSALIICDDKIGLKGENEIRILK